MLWPLLLALHDGACNSRILVLLRFKVLFRAISVAENLDIIIRKLDTI